MLEADLQREYRIDLCDLWRGRLTPRRLWVMLEGLPMDSRTAFALAGVTGDVAAWSWTNLLLGRLVNEVSHHRWEWAHAHTPKEKKSQLPEAPKSVLPSGLTEQAAEAQVPVISPGQLGRFLAGGQPDEQSRGR